jgi:hypothetical protein
MESLGLVFRALVMLACLAVVPLVALYGKFVPDIVQAVVEAVKTRTHTNAIADPNTAGGEAPPFAGSSPRTSGARSVASLESQRSGAPGPWTGRDQSARPLNEWNRQAATDTSTPSTPLERASFNAPVSGRAAEGPVDRARLAAAPTPQSPTSGPAAQLPAWSGASASRGGESQAGDPQASAGSDCTAQFRGMEKRLRELGATYYLLETWGSSGDRYRFFCKMSLAGDADYNRNRIFQATAADPLRAMQDVLAQVEQWRAGSTP